MVYGVVPLHDIAHFAIAVGNHDGTKRSAIVCESHLTTVAVREDEEIGLLPIYNFLKVGLFKTRKIVRITYVFHVFAFLE
jgi:hypothetical protein